MIFGRIKKIKKNKKNMSKEFNWVNKDTRDFLERGYLVEGVTVEDRVMTICKYAESVNQTEGFADKLYGYASKGWVSFSSPIWSNFGTDSGLPISCFANSLEDSTADILRGAAEIGMLSKYGGGTAGYFGNIRARGQAISSGGVTNGSVSFMEIYNTLMNIVSQGKVRRGNYAAYLPIDHGDFDEFMEIKSEGHRIQDISIGVTIPRGFMEKMIAGDKENRRRWGKVLKKRTETGFPYIFFSDNVNDNKPQVYKDKGLEITNSNLCTEIMEVCNDKYTFTCCLASANLLYFDDWKDTDLIETMTAFLDTVLTDFISKAKEVPFLEKAVAFAEDCRSIGLGVLGLHSYLQSKMIPYEGLETKMKLNEMFSLINAKSLKASKELAVKFGEPKMLKGYGERFTTRLSIAPTTSSSFILEQVSPQAEVQQSNYYLKDLAKGKFSYKNPYLAKLLKELNKDNKATWDSILQKGGSVQHLDFLTEGQKNVFKTSAEVSQLEVIQNYSIIQKYVDQGMSINVMIPQSVSAKEINQLYIKAWELGIKSLYYQRSTNAAQELGKSLMECVSCEA